MFFKEGFTVIGLVYKSRTGLCIYTTVFEILHWQCIE